MDYLQEGIHLRALGQRDPLVEYKSEGFDLFQDMLDGVKRQVVTALLKNRPEDLAFFTAVTLDQPVQAFNYSSRRRPGLPDQLRRRRLGVRRRRRRGGRAAAAPPRPVRRDGARHRGAALPGGAAGRRRGRAAAHVEQKIGRNDPCWCGSGKKYKEVSRCIVPFGLIRRLNSTSSPHCHCA